MSFEAIFCHSVAVNDSRYNTLACYLIVVTLVYPGVTLHNMSWAPKGTSKQASLVTDISVTHRNP